MKLQRAKARFEQQGIKLAGISYDSRAILEEFSQRHQIDFPLMADPESKVIDRYRVLNEAATGISKGMAYPGFFYLDPKGVIREKYFEANYVDRFTPNNVIAKMFPALVEEVRQKVEAPHLDLTLAQTDKAAIPGSRVSLIVEVGLPKGTHVYAPDVTGGYIPIALTLQPPPEIELAAAAYPRPKTLYLDAIKERVPVFEGKFRIVQDVRVAGSMHLQEGEAAPLSPPLSVRSRRRASRQAGPSRRRRPMPDRLRRPDRVERDDVQAPTHRKGRRRVADFFVAGLVLERPGDLHGLAGVAQ